MSLLDLINSERSRQQEVLQLVASENLPSIHVNNVLNAGFLSWTTVEGRLGNRFHGGCEIIDKIEEMAVRSCQELFDTPEAFVQPVTSSTANLAIAKIANVRGSVLSLSTSSGGHISHSRFIHNTYSFDLNEVTHRIDLEQLRQTIKKTQSKTLIIGGSSYPREIDFNGISKICEEFGVLLWADCAHLAGLIAGGLHQSPIPYCDIITASTYKTMRGPRSGFIMLGHKAVERFGNSLSKSIHKSIFPGTQSSSNGCLIAAKAACFQDAMTPEFHKYIESVVLNARTLAARLVNRGIPILTGGTDTHIVLCDVSKIGINGLSAQMALESVGILANKNQIPFDTKPVSVTSGLRLGSNFLTSRGFSDEDFIKIADIVADVLLAINSRSEKTMDYEQIRMNVKAISATRPIPTELLSAFQHDDL
ncbi:serine hydroxymethyltransferase [Microcoleus sp. S13_B4]|uniref:serine hydroxymethyltransferase n=1 Tax=Microcoleus sp. S13_B4 TaxID=3055408 RepID=UPI002FD2992C